MGDGLDDLLDDFSDPPINTFGKVKAVKRAGYQPEGPLEEANDDWDANDAWEEEAHAPPKEAPAPKPTPASYDEGDGWGDDGGSGATAAYSSSTTGDLHVATGEIGDEKCFPLCLVG